MCRVFGIGAHFVLIATAAVAQGAAVDGNAFFESRIRPILAGQCYKCHSEKAASAGKLKGELRLDSRAGVIRGGEGGPVLVPGKLEESRLIVAVRYTDHDLKMPPKVRLSPEQVSDLEKWVAMGAPDPRGQTAAVSTPGPAKRVIDLEQGRKYWAFGPLKAVQPPPATCDAQTPVDQFILAKLAAKGLRLNPPANRVTLIRRAYADLLGLTPTPQQVDAFVNDPAPDAWPRLIDSLLASDHYGERWARHWLDIVRFAESNGYEFDADRRGAYQYRDFVIKAFNADMPYTQFVRWQVAGDKLAPDNYQAGAATGFLVAGPSPGQITAKTAEPLRYDQLDDMISTLGSSMLGLTIGCARCHDHKYDPIPQRDYYRLISCFADTDSTELKFDPQPKIYRNAEDQWKAAHQRIVAKWDDYLKENLAAKAQTWVEKQRQAAAAATWQILDTDAADVLISGNRTLDAEKLAKQKDGSLTVTNKAGRRQVFKLYARTRQTNITAIRLEALADKSQRGGGPGTGDKGVFLLTRITVSAKPLGGKGKPVVVPLDAVAASSQAKGEELGKSLNKTQGVLIGWAPSKFGEDARAVYALTKPINFPAGAELTITLNFDTGLLIARPRLEFATGDDRPAVDAPAITQAGAELAALLPHCDSILADGSRAEAARWLRLLDPEAASAYEPVARHLAIEPQESFDRIFAAGVKSGRPVYYLGRGEASKKLGLASPGFLEALETSAAGDQNWTLAPAKIPGETQPATRPVEPRVAMADWLTDSRHGAGGLLARAWANRLWLHHMGRGIAANPNDLGAIGEQPTHPELLEYLASQLVDHGWRIKPLHKLIMTSAVYMQSADASEKALAVDPENKLWWRRPPQRLEAESLRDSMLAVSGALDPGMYGPGALDESNPRRSIYLTVKRSRPVLMMQLFDAPEPSQSIGQRQVTTVATQALTLMNSPFVRRLAERLARQARPSPGVDLAEAVDQAYRLTLCRHASDAEKDRMIGFIHRQGATYKGDGEAIALADVCQILLCSDEFAYID